MKRYAHLCIRKYVDKFYRDAIRQKIQKPGLMHMMVRTKPGEKHPTTGGRIGGVKFVVLCFFIFHSSYVTEHHLAKENALLYYMLVEKMDGFLVREHIIA